MTNHSYNTESTCKPLINTYNFLWAQILIKHILTVIYLQVKDVWKSDVQKMLLMHSMKLYKYRSIVASFSKVLSSIELLHKRMTLCSFYLLLYLNTSVSDHIQHAGQSAEVTTTPRLHTTHWHRSNTTLKHPGVEDGGAYLRAAWARWSGQKPQGELVHYTSQGWWTSQSCCHPQKQRWGRMEFFKCRIQTSLSKKTPPW